MVKLEIERIAFEGIDCFDHLGMNVAVYKNKEYKLVLSGVYGFLYKQENPRYPGLVGNRIRNYEKNISKLLYEFCGIQSLVNNTGSADEVFQFIMQQLREEHPVGMQLDHYWCPWHGQYQKLHDTHFTMVIGIDDNNLLCIDPLLGLDIYTLPQNDFINGCGVCISFIINEVPTIFDYKLVYRNSLEQITSSNMFNDMRRFIEDFRTKFDFSKEIVNASGNGYFQHNLYNLYNSRYTYSEFIRYIAEKTNNQGLLKYIDGFLVLKDKWAEVRFNWLKCVYKNCFSESSRTEIYKMLETILDSEENLISQLYKIEL